MNDPSSPTASTSSTSSTAMPAGDLDEDRGTHPLRLLIVSAVVLALGWGVLAVRYDAHRVQTATMLPSVPVASVGFYQPVDSPTDVRRGDIVRFRSTWPEAEGFDELTFRVLALGGQRITGTRDGRITVDGQALDEPYVDADGLAQQPFDVQVPPGRFFVAGDSRGISNDSRLHLDDGQSGTIDGSAVSGRLAGVGWPAWKWTVPDTERGLPWSFVAGSLLSLVGTLGLLVALARLAGAGFGAWRDRRRQRR